MQNISRWLTVLACAMSAGHTLANVPSAKASQSDPSAVNAAISLAPRIPPNEKGLPTIIAKPWFTVTDKTAAFGGQASKVLLEGPSFDKEGNLLFVEYITGRVMRLSPNRDLTVVLAKNTSGAAGLDIRKDGRIFVAGFMDPTVGGTLFSIRPDGSDKQIILDRQSGYVPDDVAVDSQGGFYFTDIRGSNIDPTGGVYYVAPDMKTITPVHLHMSMANGVALSPDEKTLWVSETGRGLLHRIELAAPAKIAPYGLTIPYRFTAAKADSIRTDASGNVYVALFNEGRVLVFDPRGVPIVQLLTSDRDHGEFLMTTSMAIKPGSREVYIVSNDRDGRKATIYRADMADTAVD